MMKCMRMRQAVYPSGCWNAEADGVVAESERVSQPRIDLGWRVVEMDVTVAGVIRATLSDGAVARYIHPAANL